MTAYELYKTALGYNFETSTSEYNDYYQGFINLLLAENFTLNNTLLRMKGEEDLKEIPVITSKDDEIPFQDEINRTVLPIGLAAHLAKEDEQQLYNVYIDMYKSARARLVYETPVVFEELQ